MTKPEKSNFAQTSADASSDITGKNDELKSYKVDNETEQKDAKKDPEKKGTFEEGLVGQLQEEMKENPEIKSITIAIKVSDIKEASQTESVSKVKAQKITEFKDGKKQSEEIEVEMSPQEAQAIMDEIQKNKDKSKDSGKNSDMDNARDAVKNVVNALMRNGAGNSADDVDNTNLPSREEENSQGR